MYYAWGESVVLQGPPLCVAISKVLGRRGNRWHYQDINIFEGMIIAVLIATRWLAHHKVLDGVGANSLRAP